MAAICGQARVIIGPRLVIFRADFTCRFDSSVDEDALRFVTNMRGIPLFHGAPDLAVCCSRIFQSVLKLLPPASATPFSAANRSRIRGAGTFFIG